jgi:hypothetical protein
MRLEGYAEIHVYEPHVTCDGRMEWVPITDLHFYRDFLGTSRDRLTRTPLTTDIGKKDPEPIKEPAKQTGGTREATALGGGTTTPAGGVNQVNVNQYCPPTGCGPLIRKDGSFLEKCLDLCRKHKPKVVVTEDIREGDLSEIQPQPVFSAPPATPPGGGPSLLRPGTTTPTTLPGGVPQPLSPAGVGQPMITTKQPE